MCNVWENGGKMRAQERVKMQHLLMSCMNAEQRSTVQRGERTSGEVGCGNTSPTLLLKHI